MGWVTLKTDSFARTESQPLTGYSNTAGWSINGDRLTLTNTTASSQLISSPAFSGFDQRLTSRQFGGANNGIMIRRVDSANLYGFRRAGANAQPFMVVEGRTTLLGQSLACAVGDVMTLEATESTDATLLIASINGVAQPTIRITDSANRLYGRGNGYRAQSANPGTSQFDDLLVEEFIADKLTWWDGSTEATVTFDGFWDGSSLVPSSFERNV